ncbi:MAG: SMC-Scp complex subunit ScpB [Clostridia bacterium]|nr:SMC-Scp complex subunit ScpB [Clostridia bacterium]
MTAKQLQCAIEAILFAAGEAVKISVMAKSLGVSKEMVREAVALLRYEYDTQERGLMIIDIDDGYQICSRPMYYQYIREILGEQRRQALSNAAMETLAIIAYKQPVTRGQIEHIRGVNSDGAINRLLERGLIDEAGRLDAPGRPVLYETTQVFLRCFGLKTVKDLPPIDLKRPEEYAKFEQLTITEQEA